MKGRVTILVVSLCANGWFAVQLWQNPATSETKVAAAPGSPLKLPEPRASATAARLASPATGHVNPRTTGDYQALAAELRAAGYPERVVTNIIVSLAFEQLIAERGDVLFASLRATPYWRQIVSRSTPEQEAQFDRINEQHRALLVAVLGKDWELRLSELREDPVARYGPLPGEKVSALQKIERDYHEMRDRIARKASGAIDPEANRLLEQERRRDIEQVLSSEELLEYDLRNSPTAGRVRRELAHLRLTEAEFRTVYSWYRDHELTYPNALPGRARNPLEAAASSALRARIKQILGPDRAADYRQARDPDAQAENRVATRLRLPLSTAAGVAAVKREVLSRAQAVMHDEQLPPEERAARLAALAREAEARVREAFGERGMIAYGEAGGDWLGTIVPPPPTSAPPEPGSGTNRD